MTLTVVTGVMKLTTDATESVRAGSHNFMPLHLSNACMLFQLPSKNVNILTFGYILCTVVEVRSLAFMWLVSVHVATRYI